jgi:hypothetical protein
MRNALLTLILLAILAVDTAANPAGFFGGYVGARVRAGAEPWTPADLDGLALWLDASDASTLWADTNATTAATNNGLVARWDDKSGNGNHTYQTNSALRPVTGARFISGINALDFRRSSLVANPIASTNRTISAFHVFFSALASDDSTAGSARISNFSHDGTDNRAYAGFGSQYTSGKIGFRLGTTMPINSAINVPTNACVFSYHRDFAGYNYAAINGSIAFTNTVAVGGAATSHSIQIGGGGDQERFDGVFAEIVASQISVTATDRQKLEGYLAHKWGLAGDLPGDHPYKSAAPTK